MEPNAALPCQPLDPDGAATAAAAPGQAARIREVFLAEESPLLRYAYSLTGQRETAEDIVQEAFLRLHAHWSGIANPRAWLFRSVHNLAANHHRDSKPRVPLESQSELPATGPTPCQNLRRMEAVGTLRMLLAELPAADREIIRLKYHRHMKYEEIARQTGLSSGNVGYRLHHLLKGLADSLRKLGVESAEEA